MDQPKSFWLDLFTWETWNEFLKPGGKVSGFLATPAWSVELFRYRGSARGGGTLEYVFEAGEQNSPNAVTKEKAAEIAADFMTTFYHIQVGALETQEFRTQPAILARLLFGRDQRTIATNVLCRPAAGWDSR